MNTACSGLQRLNVREKREKKKLKKKAVMEAKALADVDAEL